jgi:hypothetical protein
MFCALQLANKNNPPMTTLRTEQEVRKLKQEVKKILNEGFFALEYCNRLQEHCKFPQWFANSFSNLQS